MNTTFFAGWHWISPTPLALKTQDFSDIKYHDFLFPDSLKNYNNRLIHSCAWYCTHCWNGYESNSLITRFVHQLLFHWPCHLFKGITSLLCKMFVRVFPQTYVLFSILGSSLYFVNSSLWKRGIAWGQSRTASAHGIIWEDAGQNKQLGI